MSATVPDVPRIMRAKGWPVGASLMEHWMSLPASTAPPFSNRNDTIVTMRWALGFSRARTVFDALMRDKVWSTEPARRQVRAMLRQNGMLNGIGGCFGVFQSTQPVIHRNAVNYRSVNQAALGDFDDMAAALANFNFHVQIGGDVTAIGSDAYRVSVTMVGVYIRDQYDFTGDQELGFWDAGTNDVRHTPWFGFSRMTNETFRTWRTANSRGGDFEVFSDVEVVPLAAPDVFTI